MAGVAVLMGMVAVTGGLTFPHFTIHLQARRWCYARHCFYYQYDEKTGQLICR